MEGLDADRLVREALAALEGRDAVSRRLGVAGAALAARARGNLRFVERYWQDEPRGR